jgi:decaprenyl-phosphate phosphoribosyltransferase
MRPKQWVKNLLVVAAPAAAGALADDEVLRRVCVATVAFCMLASAAYLINDVRDAAEDRLHPRKRRRPIAAGELAADEALLASAVLLVGGLVLAGLLGLALLAAATGYVVLTLSYSVVWRHIVVLDIVALAGGFVLRAVGGGAAAPVHLSRSFMLVVTFAALMIATGKRYAELSRLATATGTGGQRRVLRSYSRDRLRAALIASAVVVLAAYVIWVADHTATPGAGWRGLSFAPLALGLARYGVLLGRGDGEAPDEMIFKDRALLAAAVAWVVLFTLGVNDGHGS